MSTGRRSTSTGTSWPISIARKSRTASRRTAATPFEPKLRTSREIALPTVPIGQPTGIYARAPSATGTGHPAARLAQAQTGRTPASTGAISTGRPAGSIALQASRKPEPGSTAAQANRRGWATSIGARSPRSTRTGAARAWVVAHGAAASGMSREAAANVLSRAGAAAVVAPLVAAAARRGGGGGGGGGGGRRR